MPSKTLAPKRWLGCADRRNEEGGAGRAIFFLALASCASVTTLPLGGGSVRVHGDAGGVRLAVSGPAASLATVYVASGDRVFVLHASAALGTGIYERVGDGYRLVQDFRWQCRDRHDGDCRSRFYGADGWWGETYATGSAERAIVIDRKLLGAGGRVVVVRYTYPGQIAAWPERPGDDTVNEDLLRGTLPAEAHFVTSSWGSWGELSAP
jgi:hypothetical protein